jgi:hypothetical protein
MDRGLSQHFHRHGHQYFEENLFFLEVLIGKRRFWPLTQTASPFKGALLGHTSSWHSIRVQHFSGSKLKRQAFFKLCLRTQNKSMIHARKAHKKSRQGCIECKRRHIKVFSYHNILDFGQTVRS